MKLYRYPRKGQLRLIYHTPTKISNAPPDQIQDSTYNRIDKHLPSIVLICLTLLTSALYFLGFEYSDTLSRSFGLGGFPGQLGLQEAMAQGALLMIGSLFVPIFVAIITITLLTIKLLNYLSNPKRILARIENSKMEISSAKNRMSRISRTIKIMKTIHEKGRKIKLARTLFLNTILKMIYLHYSTIILELKIIKMRIDYKILRLANAIKPVALSIFAALIISTFILAGQIAGTLEARSIRKQLALCDECYTYKYKNKYFLGVQIFRSNDILFIATSNGVETIPLEYGLHIERYKEIKDTTFFDHIRDRFDVF